jgi:hypothetical protein
VKWNPISVLFAVVAHRICEVRSASLFGGLIGEKGFKMQWASDESQKLATEFQC